MTSVKGWHTGRVRLMTLSASLRIVVMCSSLLSCIYILKKYCQVAETMFFPDKLTVSFFLNPKYNYSPALQEDARRPMDGNGSGDICGTTVGNKIVFFWMRWLHRS